jgi:hypothetical protein
MSEFDTTLPDWAVTELRRPVRASGAQHDRIMEMVRVAPRPRRRATAAAFYPRWFRRGVLSPSGAAMAAALTAVMTFMSFPQATGKPVAFWAEATVIGDTVVSEPVTSRLASAIADTLRIVRFALRAPNANRVALSGDFNSWSRTATQLTRDDKTGMWIGRIAVPRGAKHYAFVVDGDKWVGAPTPERALLDSASHSDSI